MVVVVVSNDRKFLHLKVFSEVADAYRLAGTEAQNSDDVRVFNVPDAQNPAEAAAAVKVGGGKLLRTFAQAPPTPAIEERGQRSVRIRRLKARARQLTIEELLADI